MNSFWINPATQHLNTITHYNESNRLRLGPESLELRPPVA